MVNLASLKTDKACGLSSFTPFDPKKPIKAPVEPLPVPPSIPSQYKEYYMKKVKSKGTLAAEKAWKTRLANQAWKTRLANQEKLAEAGRKSWDTRRKNSK